MLVHLHPTAHQAFRVGRTKIQLAEGYWLTPGLGDPSNACPVGAPEQGGNCHLLFEHTAH